MGIYVTTKNGTSVKTDLTLAQIAVDDQIAANAVSVVVTTPQTITTAITWPDGLKLVFGPEGKLVFSGSGCISGDLELTPPDVNCSTIENMRLALLPSSPSTAVKAYRGIDRINNPQDTEPIINLAHFAGQGTGDTTPIAAILHNYTDAPAMQIDNVGASPVLKLVNASNPGRRPDKASDYVGQGEFLDLQTAGIGRVFFISKNTELVWNGRGGSFVTDLTPGTGYPYSFDAYGNHTLLMQIKNNGSRLIVIQDNAGRAEILSEREAGLQIQASAGLLRLKTMAGGSVVVDCGSSNDAYLQAAHGDLKLEAESGKSVVINSPLVLRRYADIASAPALTAGTRAIAWADNIDKMITWTGAAWVASS